MNILIVGGAGYIGTHFIKNIMDNNYNILVYDNCIHGNEEYVLYGEIIKAELSDINKLDEVFYKFKPDIVVHFAAFIEVGESVKNPLKYYNNNLINTINLLNIMKKYHVNKFIFSSTAAVYGIPTNIPIIETESVNPINPYGYSKAMIEQVLKDLSASKDINYVSLRYFNAAGADEMSNIGENRVHESHLIPLILKAAIGERENIKVFGVDYDTPDGSCIRDYIHVEDLANIHHLALQYLMNGGESEIFNCGYGKGYSVLEIINMAKKITKVDFNVIIKDRRDGDPAVLIASNNKLVNKLNWIPKYNDLEYIISTAWKWELKLKDKGI